MLLELIQAEVLTKVQALFLQWQPEQFHFHSPQKTNYIKTSKLEQHLTCRKYK